jgi:hypothetical protein
MQESCRASGVDNLLFSKSFWAHAAEDLSIQHRIRCVITRMVIRPLFQWSAVRRPPSCGGLGASAGWAPVAGRTVCTGGATSSCSTLLSAAIPLGAYPQAVCGFVSSGSRDEDDPSCGLLASACWRRCLPPWRNMGRNGGDETRGPCALTCLQSRSIVGGTCETSDHSLSRH